MPGQGEYFVKSSRLKTECTVYTRNYLNLRGVWGGGGNEWETQCLWITPLQTQTLKLNTPNEENKDPYNYSIFIFKIISNTRLIRTSSMAIFPQFIKKNPTRCNSVSKFYFIFIWKSKFHIYMKIQQDATVYQNFISYLYENPNFIFIWKSNKMQQCIKILFHVYMKIQISYLYENSTRCTNVSKFYFIFIWKSKFHIYMKIQQDATTYQNFISYLYENPNFIFIWKSNKMQQCIKILLSNIYMKLNMFRATHRSSSGA